MASGHSRTLATFDQHARQAFIQFLRDNPNDKRVTLAEREDIVRWLTDPLRRPSTQQEFSRRNYIRKRFLWDAENQQLLAVPKANQTGHRVVITEDQTFEAVEEKHLEVSHRGWDTTWEALSASYYGVMRSDMIFLLKKCQICVQKASSPSKGPLAPIDSNPKFERVQVDLIDMGDIPDGKFRWVLHIKDQFSRFCQLYPLEDKEAVTVARSIGLWIGAFEPPQVLQSNDAIELMDVLKQLLLVFGFKIMHGRPRTQSIHEVMEQANRMVISEILIWQHKNGTSEWAAGLPAIALEINKACLEGTMRSPYEIVFGRSPRRETRIPITQRPHTEIEEETGSASAKDTAQNVILGQEALDDRRMWEDTWDANLEMGLEDSERVTVDPKLLKVGSLYTERLLADG